MSGPVLVYSNGEMSVAEASRVLLQPVFGNERCIAARKLLELAAQVGEYRRIAIARGVDGRSLRHLRRMTADDLREEIEEWKSVGIAEGL